jgi:putative transposase
MARLARVVVPGLAHHVTQRGNRREAIFFEPGDETIYLDLMGEQLRRRDVACWSYCLMPNHVHLILVPSDAEGLALAVGEAHRRYTAFVGARGKWTGHLFQGRFGSVAMDEDHLAAALRYVALNPVKAGLVKRAQDWPWSSTRALIAGESDARVEVGPALERVGAFAPFLAGAIEGGADEALWKRLLSAETVGRPVGEETWVKGLERRLGVRLAPQKRGPKTRRDPAEPPASGLFDG